MASELYKIVFDENVQRFVAETLNETPEIRVQALQDIKEWLKDHPNLNAKQDDSDILPFLRVCKFDVEKTKSKLKTYYTFRRDIPQWFANRNLEREIIRNLINFGVFLPLKRTFENKLVFIMRATSFDPKLYSMDDIMKASAMVLDFATYRNVPIQIYGAIAIVDMHGTCFEHAKQFTIKYMKDTILILQNYYYRPQKVIFINIPKFLGILVNLFLTFMPSKLKNRVHCFYNGVGDLNQIFDDENVLPPEYGGKGEDLDELKKFWGDEIAKSISWFEEDEKHKAD